MAKEYTYQHGNDDEYKIEWDKIQVYFQSTDREINNVGAEKVIDHEIYVDYYGEQIGYLHFSEFHNVSAKNINNHFPEKNYDNLIYINNVLVNHEFRGWGIGGELYKKFGEIYKERFENWPVAQVFVNPLAEYTFVKAIEKGNIPESANVKELISREYNKEEKEKAKELFEWLPQYQQDDLKETMEKLLQEKNASLNIIDLRGLDKWAFNNSRTIKAINSNNIDLRSLRFDHVKKTYSGREVEIINTYVDEKEVGYLMYSVSEERKVLRVDMIEVEEEFQDFGIGTALYREFGKIYNEKYYDWPIARYYVNPIAEYSFKKAVAEGFFPESAVSENHTEREYSEENNQLWQDLRDKLPSHLNDPDVWGEDDEDTRDDYYY